MLEKNKQEVSDVNGSVVIQAGGDINNYCFLHFFRFLRTNNNRFGGQSYEKSRAEQKILIFFMPRHRKFAIFDGKVTKKT